jgi:hypothetical protein
VHAAVRLANQHEERYALRQQLTGADKVQVLFQGRPQLMAERFMGCLKSLTPKKSSRIKTTDPS